MSHLLCTTAQAAKLIGVSPATTKRWAGNGTFVTATKVGGSFRIERAEVENLAHLWRTYSLGTRQVMQRLGIEWPQLQRLINEGFLHPIVINHWPRFEPTEVKLAAVGVMRRQARNF